MNSIDTDSAVLRMIELRYAWILQRKSELNEATFKIAGVYGSSLIALGAIEGFVLAQLFDGKLSKGAALSSTSTVMALLWTLSAFTTLLVLTNVFSWLSYRREEVLLEQRVGASLAKPPSLGSVYKWFELHLILGIAAVLIVAVMYCNATLLPTIAAFKRLN